jgi:hypothetical protein
MNPGKPVMSGGGGDDSFCFAEMAIGLFEAFQKARHGGAGPE